ncbi:MAG: hypothetical protein R6U46_07835 [Marinilabilia sp.]
MQHLTQEDIEVCAEALARDDFYSLPSGIREHLATCDRCSGAVLKMVDVPSGFSFKEPDLPVFRSKSQKLIAWGVSLAAGVVFLLLITDGHEILPAKDFHNDLVQNDDESSGLPFESKISGVEIKVSEKASPGKDEGSQSGSGNESSENVLKVESSGSKEVNATPHLEKRSPAASGLEPHYQRNEDFEELIGRTLADSETPGEISVHTPLTTTTDGSSVVVEWSNPENERLIVEIVDNRDQLILKDETNDRYYRFENLSDGLYYWKLISEDSELLFCGRILVAVE